MAQRIRVVLIDDLDGTELETGQAVTFSHMGVTYEIDLSEENVRKLDAALAPFVDAARRVGGRRTRKTSPSAAPGVKEDLAPIRHWARDNGYQVSPRGRVRQDIKDAYYAAS